MPWCPDAYATGCVDENRALPFSLHVSVAAPTALHFVLTSAATPPFSSSTASLPRPFTRVYQLSPPSASTASDSSIKSFLASLAHTAVLPGQRNGDAAVSSLAPNGARCEACGGREDGVAPDQSGTTRSLHLLQYAYSGDHLVFSAPVRVAVDNVVWRQTERLVHADVAVLFACGCCFLLRAHLPVVEAPVTAGGVQTAQLAAALRLPLSQLFRSPDGASTITAVSGNHASSHLSMMTLAEPRQRHTGGAVKRTGAGAGLPTRRLHVLASLDDSRVCAVVCLVTTSPGMPWSLTRMGTLAIAQHHAHPFHLIGRCTLIRQLAWVPGSTDFTGDFPLVAFAHQYVMGHDGAGHAMEPPSDHLSTASLRWQSSQDLPCLWKPPTNARASAQTSLPVSIALSVGELTDGPWAVKHLALTPCSTFALRSTGGHVAFFTRAAHAPHLPSTLLREAAAAEVALSSSNTEERSLAAEAAIDRPYAVHEAARALARDSPAFCVLDTQSGELVEVALTCVCESAVPLATLGCSSAQLAAAADITTVATVGYRLDRTTVHMRGEAESPASAQTPRKTRAQRVLCLLHVTSPARAGAGVVAATRGANLRGGETTRVDPVYCPLPDTLDDGESLLFPPALIGGWWNADTQRGVLHARALRLPVGGDDNDDVSKDATGACLSTVTFTLALSTVAGHLTAQVVDSADLGEPGWPRSRRALTFTDLLAYHHVTTPMRELAVLAGLPSGDSVGLEVVTRAATTHASGLSSTADTLLLRNGLFVSVTSPPATNTPPHDTSVPRVRVLSRLQWPTSAPVRGTALMQQQAAIESLLSSEQDGVVSRAWQCGPTTDAATEGLLVLCVVKCWGLLLDPLTGRLLQAVRLCMAPGFTPTQLTLAKLNVDLAEAAASDATSPASPRHSAHTCAVLFVAGLCKIEDKAPDVASASPCAVMAPYLTTLTLTSRAFRAPPPVEWPRTWSPGANSGPLAGELAALQRVADTAAAAVHPPRYDLTLGGAAVLLAEGTNWPQEEGISAVAQAQADADATAKVETIATAVSSRVSGPPALAVWATSPEEVTPSLSASFSLSFLPSSCVREAARLTATLKPEPLPVGNTHVVQLTRLSTVTPHVPAATLLGVDWPLTHAPFFTAVMPLTCPLSAGAGGGGGSDMALVVVHHRPWHSTINGDNTAEDNVHLQETVLLAKPGRHGAVYMVYDAPLAAVGIGAPPALMESCQAALSSSPGDESTRRYLVDTVTMDAQQPLSFDVHWSLAAAESDDNDQESVSPVAREETGGWRGPLARLPRWLTRVSHQRL